MRLFYLESPAEIGQSIVLSQATAHRFSQVLRLSPGYCFEARDEFGQLYQLELTFLNKKSAEVCVISKTAAVLPDCPLLKVWQAIPKATKFDELIPPLVEAGVGQIVPIKTAYSEAVVSEARQQRWKRLLIEAIDQSGNRVIQPIKNVVTLQDLLVNLDEHSLKLFCHQTALKKVSLTSLLQKHDKRFPIVLAIGPEGGFSHDEVALFFSHGFHALTFYDSILRSEHAAFFFVAAIKMIDQEIRGL